MWPWILTFILTFWSSLLIGCWSKSSWNCWKTVSQSLVKWLHYYQNSWKLLSNRMKCCQTQSFPWCVFFCQRLLSVMLSDLTHGNYDIKKVWSDFYNLPYGKPDTWKQYYIKNSEIQVLQFSYRRIKAVGKKKHAQWKHSKQWKKYFSAWLWPLTLSTYFSIYPFIDSVFLCFFFSFFNIFGVVCLKIAAE